MSQDNVVRLSAYRKRQQQTQRQRRPENTRPILNGAMYYCLRCDNDTFKMFASGAIYCANPKCGAFMRNLTVQQETETK